MIKLKILGTIGVGEIVAMGILPFIPISECWKNRYVRKFVFLLLLWLLAIVLSDAYNNSELVNFLKGFFNVVIILVLLPVVYWALYDKPERLIYFLIGAGISKIISYYFIELHHFDTVFNAQMWKVYAYLPITIGVSGFLYYKGRKWIAIFLMEGFALWTLFNLSRHVFLITTIAICLLLIINNGKVQKTYDYIRIPTSKVVKMLLVAAIGFVGVKYGYETLATNGALGERAYVKYMSQKNSKMGLASGRGDFVQAVFAISKEPIWGYGSYAKNTDHFFREFNKAADLGVRNTGKVEPSHMPTHSYILGAWVSAGILAVPFWIYALYLSISFLFRYSCFDARMALVNLEFGCLMIWNILFSPFQNRLDFLFFMIIACVVIQRANSTLKRQYKSNLILR